MKPQKVQNPDCCKHVTRAYSEWLDCAVDKKYDRKKCVDGIGDCKYRAFRYSKKVREISEVKV